jgi:hypothetical protein
MTRQLDATAASITVQIIAPGLHDRLAGQRTKAVGSIESGRLILLDVSGVSAYRN